MKKQLTVVGVTYLAIGAIVSSVVLHKPAPTQPVITTMLPAAGSTKQPAVVPKPKFHTTFGTYNQNLILAYNIAVDVGVPPLSIQGIMLKESRAGRVRSLVNKGAYGLMQVKVEAARSVLKRNPELLQKYFHTSKLSTVSYNDIAGLMLSNREANIRIGCHHLAIYADILDGDWDAAVAAYNMGIGNALKRVDTLSTYSYTVSVNEYAYTVLNEFNAQHTEHLYTGDNI